MTRPAPPSHSSETRRSPPSRGTWVLATLAPAAVLAVVVLGSLVSGCGGSDNPSPGTGGYGGGRGGAAGPGSAGRGGHGGSAGSAGASGVGGRGGGFAGAIGFGGSSSGAGGQAGGAGASGAGGIAGCVVKVQAVSPASFDNIEAAPRVKMKVRAMATNALVVTPTWKWKITAQVGGRLMDNQIAPLDPSAAQVEFPLEAPDTYEIVASVVEDTRCAGHAYAHGIAPGIPAYVFRTTAAEFPVQETRVVISPPPPGSASTSAAGPSVTLTLDRGQTYLIRPRGSGQTSLLAAYVRITSPATAFTVEGDTAYGAVMARLLPQLTYNLLLVPADPSFAPELLTAPPGDWSQGIDLDPGIHATGMTVTSDGKPLAGARLILRSNQRPSTIGVSDAAGNLDLWTRAGNLSVTAVPPPGSGLAQASVDVTADSMGVVLPRNAPSPALAVQWKSAQQAGLVVKVLGRDGVTPAAGARVRASSDAWKPPVATVTASLPGSAPTTLDARGEVNEDAVTDPSGTATFAALPVGTYNVTVVPVTDPASATPSAMTGAVIQLDASVTRTITLAAKATLAGTLAPVAAANGATITAFDQSSGLVAAPVTTRAASDGSFMMPVDPGRTYQLTVQPSPAQGYARTIVGGTAVGATRTDVPPTTLTRGQKVSGAVSGAGAGPLDHAFVQVFCEASSASCVDPATPLAEAVSAADGSFEVVLPVPPSK